MYNVTLVFTHHGELGKCNSDELYKIIESIAPDVIFEELQQGLFDKFYPENQLPCEPPEVTSVRRYIQTHTVDHIPVDIEVSQSLSTQQINYLFGIFSQFKVYKNIEDEQYRMIVDNGYTFLNSKECEELHMQRVITEQSLLQFLPNKNELSRLLKLFYEEHEVREYEMIKNIYNYSERKPFNQGLFFIGSAHRKSILEKIETYKTPPNLKLNWALYSA